MIKASAINNKYRATNKNKEDKSNDKYTKYENSSKYLIFSTQHPKI